MSSPGPASESKILSSCPTSPYKQFVLFGDSITQGAYDQSRGFAMGAQLAHDYIRRLDVINRGFSGYNTNHALAILPHVFRSPDVAKIDYLSVWFGANDACIPGCSSHQHVPLETYRQNLHKILSHPLILAHDPRIILITTPAVDEYQLEDDHRSDGTVDKGRSTENARAYAQAAKEVSEELIAKGRQVVVCDIWAAMMARVGWRGETPLPGSLDVERNPIFTEMLYDGLHFNPLGYKLLYDEIRKVMTETWPDSEPDRLEKHFPEWTAWFERPAVDWSEVEK